MECGAPVYRPRDAEHTVLHQVIAEHLEPFLRAVAEAGDGAGLPHFVEREFRDFLRGVRGWGRAGLGPGAYAWGREGVKVDHALRRAGRDPLVGRAPAADRTHLTSSSRLGGPGVIGFPGVKIQGSGHFICSRERTDYVLPTPAQLPVDSGAVSA
jgi:hypothetical protein